MGVVCRCRLIYAPPPSYLASKFYPLLSIANMEVCLVSPRGEMALYSNHAHIPMIFFSCLRFFFCFKVQTLSAGERQKDGGRRRHFISGCHPLSSSPPPSLNLLWSVPTAAAPVFFLQFSKTTALLFSRKIHKENEERGACAHPHPLGTISSCLLHPMMYKLPGSILWKKKNHFELTQKILMSGLF